MTPISDCNIPLGRLVAVQEPHSGYCKKPHKRFLAKSWQVSKQRQTGFTLLEIILVLTIIGMASILVVPNITSLESRSFSAQVRQANSLLNYARRSAVVLGHPVKASFSPFASDSRPSETNDRASRGSTELAWSSAGSSLRYRDSTNTEVLVEDKIDILFFPEGGSTGGTLIFGQDGIHIVIQVDPFTGRIDTLADDHDIYQEL